MENNMGTISRPIILRETIDLFDIKHVVETGTGVGDSVQYLCDNFPPDKFHIYSIELIEELYNYAVERFRMRDNVTLLCGYSDIQLENLCNIFIPDEPTLFWLDAHYPGADFRINGATYECEPNLNIRLPMHEELKTIIANRGNVSNDVFILDDLRIYKDGPFQNGNCDRSRIGAEGNQFVYDLFADTHNIYETYLDEGYVVLLPNKIEAPHLHLINM
jgi:hypothetical protein